MSYYISKDGQIGSSVIVKRIRDFTGKEGQLYTVRTRRKVGLMDMIPVYKFTNGKLVKTDSVQTLWI